MWLSEQHVHSNRSEKNAKVAAVTIGGVQSAVQAGSEIRGLETAAPGGYVWVPQQNREVLTMPCDNGEMIILGVVGDTPPAGMHEGEVYLHAGSNASVFLRRDGQIVIKGTVNVEGSLCVNGVPVNMETS